MDDIDSESSAIEEWWEWPAELNDDEIEQLQAIAKAQPLELYNQGWDRVSRNCTFFGPLKLPKCD